MSDIPNESDLLAQIEADLAVAVVDYEPAVGDQVVGYVDSIDYMDVKGDEVPVVMLKVADGTFTRVFCGRARLRKELARQLVQPGDAVGIKYEGQPQGKSYHSYRITVHRVGERQPELAFRNPESSDELGLRPDAATEKPSNPWGDATTEPAF